MVLLSRHNFASVSGRNGGQLVKRHLANSARRKGRRKSLANLEEAGEREVHERHSVENHALEVCGGILGIDNSW